MRIYMSSVRSSAIVVFSILVSATFCGDAYGSEKVLDELVSLFSSGVIVEESQVNKLIIAGKTGIVRDEPLRRHYRISLNDQNSQVTALSFGVHRSDESSQAWIVAALAVISADKKAQGCERYIDIIKKYAFVEGMREPRAVIKNAAWTQPATLTKGPYNIYVSTTDVTSPCASGLTVSTRLTDRLDAVTQMSSK
ncbi:hypothetical protein LMG19146_01796 [Xanthomonas arboricola pv. fragariae]|uniref:hypothetical protein n=1 Tax=Xanthomonas arboricola TaxID=56448 RepID=UPI000CB8116A|nr:hypothetical protein [Xanthomonas arboricola]SOT99187.1 hypothetical protein LMG19146_01796 [Xanthomonas arboricola pv. fragariae]